MRSAFGPHPARDRGVADRRGAAPANGARLAGRRRWDPPAHGHRSSRLKQIASFMISPAAADHANGGHVRCRPGIGAPMQQPLAPLKATFCLTNAACRSCQASNRFAGPLPMIALIATANGPSPRPRRVHCSHGRRTRPRSGHGRCRQAVAFQLALTAVATAAAPRPMAACYPMPSAPDGPWPRGPCLAAAQYCRRLTATALPQPPHRPCRPFRPGGRQGSALCP